MMDTYPALMCGAAICIVPEEMRLDLEAMNNYFEKIKLRTLLWQCKSGGRFTRRRRLSESPRKKRWSFYWEFDGVKNATVAAFDSPSGGKVNRRTLLKPEIQRDVKKNIIAPLNVIEKELKDISTEIIGNEKFGITNNFNELSLTSISAIKLATKIYKKYGI